jgi:hypothetical protein
MNVELGSKAGVHMPDILLKGELLKMKTRNVPDKYIGDMLRSQLKEYELAIGDMTEEERTDLREWVSAGNSVYCNPHLLYEESGSPFDYITAIRIAGDMLRNPEGYRISPGSGLCADAENDALPF